MLIAFVLIILIVRHQQSPTKSTSDLHDLTVLVTHLALDHTCL